jgi:hypothetical protein
MNSLQLLLSMILPGKFVANVVSAQEYYPFGMQLPRRGFSSGAIVMGLTGRRMKGEGKFASNTPIEGDIHLHYISIL